MTRTNSNSRFTERDVPEQHGRTFLVTEYIRGKSLHDRYDMNKHAQSDGDQTTVLTDEFMSQYAILGEPQHCIERLQAIAALGIDKVCIAGPALRVAPGNAGEAARRLATDIMPAFA